jgi:hypothetical protein
MKNLLIYVSPDKKFSPEHEVLNKIQIDNSLGLGWKPEDILLVTNFPWSWKSRGINAVPLEGNFDHFDGNRSSKIAVINKMFEVGMVNDLMWFHDHDAFQLEPFKAPDLGSEVAAFTDHGYSSQWNAGSFFFNSNASQLFKDIYKTMCERNLTEQNALTYMWSQGLKSMMLNNTYNVGIYRHDKILPKMNKPMLVAHFHPQKAKHRAIFREYLTPRLIDLFNEYGMSDTPEIAEKITFLKGLRFDRSARYREWEPYLTKYHCDIVAELGVRQGFHFEYLIKHNPKEAIAIDCWVDDGFAGRNDACYDQGGLDRQYEKFKGMMADKPFVRVIKEYTFDAVRRFPDEYFDYIFIDADHTYEGISKDLIDWYPKVKKGGVFCGHDYVTRRARSAQGKIIKFGVVEAVDEFVKKNKITTFFLLKPNTTWGVIKV